jgi:hypothetical protein
MSIHYSTQQHINVQGYKEKILLGTKRATYAKNIIFKWLNLGITKSL